MNLPIEQLKSRLSSLKSQTSDPEEECIWLHDLFMKEYGWIPLEEFKSLPIPTSLNLFSCIKKRREIEKREMDKMKHKSPKARKR